MNITIYGINFMKNEGSAIFKRFFKCCFAVPISLRRKLRKKTHTHQAVFLWKIKGKVLKLFVFAIQF